MYKIMKQITHEEQCLIVDLVGEPGARRDT